MGNQRSKQKDITSVHSRSRQESDSGRPVHKLAKLEPIINENNCSTAVIRQESNPITSYFRTPQADLHRWETLPYVAVLQIYHHLTSKDKASMAMTCKTWLLPFNRSALWRRGTFRFDGVDDCRALRFVALMGSALRHMTVDCSASEGKLSNRAKTSAINFSIFLSTLLKTRNRKLETICVRNLNRLFRYTYYHDNVDIFKKLLSLIEKQEGLETLDISNAGLMETYAFEILYAIQSPSRVKRLHISDMLTPMQRFNFVRNPHFIPLIQRFANLTDLSLSDDYISDGLLMTLTETVSLTLRRMEVKVLYNLTRRPNDELEGSWDYFCAYMVHLELAFAVKGMYAGHHLEKVLPWTLILHSLEWDAGTCLLDMNSFYQRVSIFKNTLTYLKLKLQILTEYDVDYLVRLLESLSNVKTVSIDALTMSSSARYRLEYSIRCYVSSERTSEKKCALNKVWINGKKLEFQESWSSYFMSLLAHVSENMI